MSPRAPLLTSLFLLLGLASPATAKTGLETEPPPLPAARLVGGDAVESASASELRRPAPPPGAKAAEIDAALAAQLALARARWELDRDDLAVGSVVPLVGPDGEVVAWDVDFRLDAGSFAEPTEVCREWRDRPGRRLDDAGSSEAAKANLSGAEAYELELRSARFYSVTVSATWDAPPIRASRAGVTNFYAAAPRMASIAGELLQTDAPQLDRVYPLSSWARAYEFRANGRSIVIEGQEPWRYWNGEEYRAAKQAHVEWRRERARTVQLAKGKDPDAMLLSERAKNEALADQWLSGAVAPKAGGWIEQSSAFEPFFWYGGCSPTAGSMVLNYYDRRDESGLGVGMLNRWYSRRTSPVTGTINCKVPEVAPRLRTLMDTDGEGSTSIFDIRPGLKTHVEQRGYCDGGGPDWLGDLFGWHFDDMVNQLNLSRPFVWSCDFYPGADTGHSVGVVGYDTTAEDLYCYNTWNDGTVTEAVHHAGGITDWSSIDGVTPACYDSQADIRLTAPQGRHIYDDSTCLPAFIGDAGCPFSVTWERSLGGNTRVQVYHSIDAGNNWTFVEETEDDGDYRWTAPSWPLVEVRIRLDRVVYESGTPRVIASDGSRGNSQVIAPMAHDCLVAVDQLHFSATAYGSVDMQYFTIENQTCDTIDSPFLFVGSDEFEITQPSLYLEPGWDDYIHVWYRPECGPDTAILYFPNSPCASVQLIAQGPTAPVCAVSTQRIDLPFDQVGLAVNGEFMLRNEQCGVLSGNLTLDDPDFSVSPSSYSLGPGDSLQVTVSFMPAGCFPDTCHIDTGPLCGEVICYAEDVLSPGGWQAITTGPLSVYATGTGVSAGDYDQDGDDDLYVVRYEEANVLLRNDGNLVFTDVTTASLANSGPGYGAAWGDSDNDGDLDLYVANYGTPDVLLLNNGAGGFAQMIGGALAVAAPSFVPEWVDIDGDSDLDIYVSCGEGPNFALRNNGGNSFTRITSLPLATPEYAMDAAWSDYDRDGDPDLYLVNYGEADKLLRNDGGWSFTEVDNNPYFYDSGGGMSAAWGDADGDGDLDLFLGKYGSGSRLFFTAPDGRLVPNTPAPLDDPVYATSVSWTDCDLDGDLDLYQYVHSSANRMLRYGGGTTWTDVAADALANAGGGFGQAWADFDGDGRQDVYLNLYEGTGLLCLNKAADITCRNWLEVDLRGTQSNFFGVGAQITVVAGGKRQLREVGAGSGGMGQNSLTAHFGLAAATTVDSLIVRWPWRATQIHTDLPVNQRLTLVEGGGVTAVRDPETPSRLPIAAVALLPVVPNPFNPATSIRFELPRSTRVTLEVHDVAGRRVRTLIDGLPVEPGRFALTWDGRDHAGREVSSGIYFCRLRAEGEERRVKMVLLR